MQLTARADGEEGGGEREREERRALSALPDARRRDTIVAARLDGGRGVCINRRHVDRPSGLSPVLRYCMHATRAIRAREGWFSHIDLRRASLCITDYDDNVVTRTRPGPPGDTHPRKEAEGAGEGAPVSGRRYSRKVCTSTRIAFGNVVSNIYSRHTFSSGGVV